MSDDDLLRLEVDGGGVEPDTIDARSLLALASAFLDLLERLSDEAGEQLAFRGLSIENKCVEVQTRVMPPSLGLRFAQEAVRLVDGRESPPSGTERAVQRAQRALRMLPEGLTSKLQLGDQRWAIALPADSPAPTAFELVEFRARVLKVGGEHASVRLDAEIEGVFTLGTSRTLAVQMGKHLYGEVDIEARVLRDETGAVERGTITAFHALSDDEPVSAWRTWLRAEAPGWDEVDDVVKELRRDD